MNPLSATALATAVGPHLYWITSRAAGSAALILSSLSVCAGLLMGGRLLKRSGPELRVTHEALSLATIGALLVHGPSLLGDGFLHPSFGEISVPFLSGYETFWTALGIIAFWVAAAARALLLRARAHRRGTLAPAAPLHRARVAARHRARARRGHGCRTDL